MLNQPNYSFSSPDNAQQDGRLRQAQMKMLTMLGVVDRICQKHGLDYWLEGGTLLGAVRHQGFIPWDDDMDISMPRASFEAFLKLAPPELPENMVLQTANSDPGFYNLAVPLKIRDKNSRFVEMHELGQEPYLQGIFIDVFVYDQMPKVKALRRGYKFLAKKIVRVLSGKCTTLKMGHHQACYKWISTFFSRQFLQKALAQIINKANSGTSSYLGYGYDCINQNLVHREEIYPLKRVLFEECEVNIAHKAEVILTQLYGDYLKLPPEAERVMKHCRELIPFYNE